MKVFEGQTIELLATARLPENIFDGDAILTNFASVTVSLADRADFCKDFGGCVMAPFFGDGAGVEDNGTYTVTWDWDGDHYEPTFDPPVAPSGYNFHGVTKIWLQSPPNTDHGTWDQYDSGGVFRNKLGVRWRQPATGKARWLAAPGPADNAGESSPPRNERPAGGSGGGAPPVPSQYMQSVGVGEDPASNSRLGRVYFRMDTAQPGASLTTANFDFVPFSASGEDPDKVQVIRPQGSASWQVVTGDSIVTVAQTTANQVQVAYHSKTGATQGAAGELWDTTGAAPTATHNYSFDAATKVLTGTNADASGTSRTWSGDATGGFGGGSWEKIVGNEREVGASVADSQNAAKRTESTAFYRRNDGNSGWALVKTVTQTFELLDHREVVIEENVQIPGGALETTLYAYYTANAPVPGIGGQPASGYPSGARQRNGRVKSVRHSDGSWEVYDYDQLGERYLTVTPFGSALATPPADIDAMTAAEKAGSRIERVTSRFGTLDPSAFTYFTGLGFWENSETWIGGNLISVRKVDQPPPLPPVSPPEPGSCTCTAPGLDEPPLCTQDCPCQGTCSGTCCSSWQCSCAAPEPPVHDPFVTRTVKTWVGGALASYPDLSATPTRAEIYKYAVDAQSEGSGNGVRLGRMVSASTPDSYEEFLTSAGSNGQPTTETTRYAPHDHTIKLTRTISNSAGRTEQVYLPGAVAGTGSFVTISSRTEEKAGEVRTVKLDGIIAQVEQPLAGNPLGAESIDQQGIVTRTMKNSAGEVVSETKLGMAAAGAYAAQPDIETTFTEVLDGALTRRIIAVSAGGMSFSEHTLYDAEGRSVGRVDAFGRSFRFSRSADGLTETETGPGGGTRSSTRFLDGQTRSSNGTAAPFWEYHQHATDALGRQIHTTYAGDEGTGATRSRSWTRQFSDGLGNTLREEAPTVWPATGTVATLFDYDGQGRLSWVRRLAPLRSELFETSADGRTTATSSAYLPGSATIDRLGTEPVTESVQTFESSQGALWAVRKDRVYTTPNSSTAFRETITKIRQNMGTETEIVTIYPDGRTTTWSVEIDRENRTKVETFSETLPGVAAPRTHSRTYRNGLLVVETRPGVQGAIAYQYDPLGHLAKIIDPATGTREWSWHPDGRVKAESDAAGNVTSYSYYLASDADGDGVTDDQNAALLKTVTRTLSEGALTRQLETHFEYDLAGRVSRQWGNAATPVRYQYDPGTGNLVKMHTKQSDAANAPEHTTMWTYAPSHTGLLTRKLLPDGSAQLYTYNAHGQLVTKSFRKPDLTGTAESYLYSQGRLAAVTFAANMSGLSASEAPGRQGAITHQFTYARDGSLSTVRDPGGLHTFSHPAANSTLEAITAASAVPGNPSLLAGLTFCTADHWAGQPASFSVTVGTTPVAGFTESVDALGRFGGVSGAGVSATASYDSSTGRRTGLAIQPAAGSGAVLARHVEYDAAGRVSALSYRKDSPTAQWAASGVLGWRYPAYDELNRRKTLEAYSPDDGLPGWAYADHDRGGISAAARSRPGSSQAVPSQVWAYVFDAMGNRVYASRGLAPAVRHQFYHQTSAADQYEMLPASTHREINGIAQPGAAVSLTIEGQAAAVDMTGTGEPDSWRADPSLDWLSSEGAWADIQVTATLGAQHSTRSGWLYLPPLHDEPRYDGAGNLVADARQSYEWDGRGQLRAVEDRVLRRGAELAGMTGGSAPRPVPVRRRTVFDYDWQGRRIGKAVYERAATGWVRRSDTRFVYEGWNLVAELDAQAGLSVLRQYVWGPDLSGGRQGAGGVGGLIGMEAGGAAFAILSEVNGNVMGIAALSGPQAGQLAARFDYDAFGNRITNTGPDVELCPFGFSSKYFDAETGLAYYGFRYYSPEMGRWLSRDPAEEQGGLNLYGMVGNDTINRIDMLGLADILVEMNRSYFDWDTLSNFTAKATDKTIASCCKEVKGQTIELKKGEYSLVKQGDYFHGNKNYPIPEGDHTGNWSPSSSTSIRAIVNSINSSIIENYNQQMAAYQQAVQQSGGGGAPNLLERIFGRIGQGGGPSPPGEITLYGIPDGEFGNNNILINPGGNFSGTRMHIGENCNWSRGCPIVGKNAQMRTTQITIYEGSVGKEVQLHNFNLDDSYEVATALGKLVLCVKKQLGKTPTIEVKISH